MMTQKRAIYILANGVIGGDFRYAFPRDYAFRGGIVHPDGITREEDAHIRRVWETMPGSSSYFDAVCHIAQGKAGKMRACELERAARPNPRSTRRE